MAALGNIWNYGLSWFFILGQPTESDLTYLFDREIMAYVLPDHVLAGEC